MQGQKDFSANTDELVDSITNFYTRYGDVRDVLPYEVLDSLGDGLSLEEIHKFPFMRHQQPTE